MKVLTLSGILFFAAATAQIDPYKKLSTIPEKLEVLPFGEVRPTNWIYNQIEGNMRGFTGHLDSLVPDLIVKDDIYIENRLTKKVSSKDVGAIGGEGDWQVQFLWWNSETQSNWRDGYIRSAILSDTKQHLEKTKMYVNKILASQDEDGYLGIYDKDLRYTFDNENGELWAKATLLRGLLAWYDYTKEEKVMTAVKRAVDNTMQGFPINASHPFYSVNENVGGLSHGLTFTDVLEELYRHTKDKKYLDYVLFLYKDFSVQKLNEDAQVEKLLQAAIPLKGHGVHTYEHLRSLVAAYYASGNPQLLNAIEQFEAKIATTTTASGGPVGDEWIGGRKADATSRGYEYCSLQELLHSYESLLAKTGDSGYGDKIENLFFNAAQGARHPEESCIAYLKSDNSYAMTGGLNGDASDAKQTRYRYSPVHKEAAVCCVPNAGRIAPYYAQYMWLKDKNSLVAALLGPSTLTTQLEGKKVEIIETTAYPYENDIQFEIRADFAFDLKIRKPGWAKTFRLNMPYREEGGFIVISKKWKNGDLVKLEFFPEAEVKQDLNGEYYFTYGPLVLAHPIEASEKITKEYALPGFSEKEYSPKKLLIYNYIDGNRVRQSSGKKLHFYVSLLNPETGKSEDVPLVPLGETILRQLTFKK